MDYSSSMSGNRIRAAREALKHMVDTHLGAEDYFSLSRFSTSVDRMMARTIKSGNEGHLRTTIDSLSDPSGRTAMNDAIQQVSRAAVYIPM